MTAQETAPPRPRGHTAGTHTTARKNRRRETVSFHSLGGTKKGEEDERNSCRSSQPSKCGQSNGPAELENTKKLVEDALHSAASTHTSKLAIQYGGASQQCGREDEQHGDRNGCAARKPARSEGKPAVTATRPGTRGNGGQEPAGASSTEEQEPGELVIDEHTPTPPDSPPQTTRRRPALVEGGSAATAPLTEYAAETVPRRSGRQAQPPTNVPNPPQRWRAETFQGGSEAARQAAGERRRLRHSVRARRWRRMTWTRTATSTDEVGPFRVPISSYNVLAAALPNVRPHARTEHFRRPPRW
ncbi:hypothetical protein HPB50_028916 [Hyalomma asiaticum]|nr:hypothetical protein HPB50_028916 [Hyalomma asiaticum]